MGTMCRAAEMVERTKTVNCNDCMARLALCSTRKDENQIWNEMLILKSQPTLANLDLLQS